MFILGEVDEYYNKSDTKEFTNHRIENKIARYEDRGKITWTKPSELPENRQFMVLLRDYMSNRQDVLTRGENSSVNKTICHLLTYPDSFLNYNLSLDSTFNMKCLIDFNSHTWKGI